MVIQEHEDILRILYSQQEPVPLAGSVHGQMRSLPLLLWGVGNRDGGLHDSMEQLVTLLGDIVLVEGSNSFHGLQGAINLVSGGIGAPNRRHELIVDSGNLRTALVTIVGR